VCGSAPAGSLAGEKACAGWACVTTEEVLSDSTGGRCGGAGTGTCSDETFWMTGPGICGIGGVCVFDWRGVFDARPFTKAAGELAEERDVGAEVGDVGAVEEVQLAAIEDTSASGEKEACGYGGTRAGGM
jgi:hypothetical protein